VLAIFWQGAVNEMFHSTAHMTVHQPILKGLQIEAQTDMVYGVGQVLSGIRQCPVQIEHEKMNLSFHPQAALSKDRLAGRSCQTTIFRFLSPREVLRNTALMPL